MALFVCSACLNVQDAPDSHVGRASNCVKCGNRGVVEEEAFSDEISQQIATDANESDEPASSEKSIRPMTPTAIPNKKNRLKKPFPSIDLVIALLFAILLTQLFQLTRTKKWEYKIESPYDSSLETTLQLQGNQGWELVFARRAVTRNSSIDTARYEMIFRRPK